MAKYEKEGDAQKQRRRSNKVKDVKSTSTSGEQSNHSPCQGNCAAMQYSGPVAPWFWLNPCSYTPMDYSGIHMQSYFIQYPPIYLNCDTSQRSIVASNNLVINDLYCSKEGEKSTKQDSKYLQPR